MAPLPLVNQTERLYQIEQMLSESVAVPIATLLDRLEKRLADLKLEAQLSPRPPVVLGGLLVVPIGLAPES